jgi:hypothetical protein
VVAPVWLDVPAGVPSPLPSDVVSRSAAVAQKFIDNYNAMLEDLVGDYQASSE